ncbi:MAG: hypothetical protein BTN85_1010 [Candidatus Methanohalarchaeum thermophilum]|uniref:Uncharacterized protein n=1 Tax=Methanohalarchaeum thermophilum TaxID=1903181 RepID=A0A1Q6DVZ6_METT1|nr:MAG: hypothetical protein BTN85_1010 [Candidatus Methanohalarchaeum thermophilum]
MSPAKNELEERIDKLGLEVFETGVLHEEIRAKLE